MDKQYLGLLTGAAFGIFITFFAILGIVSSVAEILGRILAGFGRALGLLFGGNLLIVFLANATLYAGIGYAAQRALARTQQNEKWVLYGALALAGILILLILIEGLFGKLGA